MFTSKHRKSPVPMKGTVAFLAIGLLLAAGQPATAATQDEEPQISEIGGISTQPGGQPAESTEPAPADPAPSEAPEAVPTEAPVEEPAPTAEPADPPAQEPAKIAEPTPEEPEAPTEEAAEPEEKPEEDEAPAESKEAQLEQELKDAGIQVAGSGYVLPLKSKSYELTSYFGARCPVAVGAGVFHGAIDLAAPRGTNLYAMADGKVDSVTPSTGTLRIRHSGNLIVSYGHIDNVTQFVKVGQSVRKGQLIAKVGNTGISNGPHVHLNVMHNGRAVDPLKFFGARGIDFKKHAKHVRPNTNASSCQVYTTARTALKSSPDNHASTIRILNKNQRLTLIPRDYSGFWKVTTPDGKTGYIHAYRASTKNNPNTQPGVRTGSAAKKTYVVTGSRHLFDYPGTTESSRGILHTIPKGQTFKTTGKTANGYHQVQWNGMTGWLKLDAVRAAPNAVTAHRFWSPKFTNAHFYTINGAEADKIRKTDRNWKYEGAGFKVWPKSGSGCFPGQTAVHRFWSSKFNSHFYTRNGGEANNIRKNDRNWKYEGVAFCVSSKGGSGLTPVHRFWSSKFNKHFYTANASEANNIRKNDRNWKYEGVAWYTPR